MSEATVFRSTECHMQKSREGEVLSKLAILSEQGYTTLVDHDF